VGFLDLIGFGSKSATSIKATDFGILSQYASSDGIKPLVVAEALGFSLATQPIDRDAALAVPAVSKGRALLTSSIAKFPLRVLDQNGPIADQPTWLYRTNGDVSPYARMVCTIDDLIFRGRSLWLTKRGAAGQILEAEWCPPDLWRLQDGKFYVEGRKTPLDDTEMILFVIPLWPGLLTVGSSNLRGARDVERAWQGRARNPIPVMVIRETEELGLSQAEIDAYVDSWAGARDAENGAIGYLPKGLELDVHGEVSPDLMSQGRNATKTDVANYLNVPASLLDGSLSEASLTYTTQEGNRNLFYDLSLPFWTDPIAHRLSQDDCVPRGQRVRFDFYEQYAPTPSPTGPTELD